MTTYHSIQRAKERTGFNLKSSERFIETALRRGRGAEAFSAKEKDYLLQKEAKEGCRMLVYNLFCFIVAADDACITMYPAPNWFGKKKYHDGKREIKDIKKYMRYYDWFEQEVEYGIC